MRRAPLAGALTAVVTGGIISLLVTIAGRELSGFTGAILALTAPLVAAGALFGWLDETGRLPSLGRAMAYWGAAFSASRLIQQLLVGAWPPKDGLIGFLIYQATVGMLFGLGFVMLHQRVMAGFDRMLGAPSTREAEGDTSTAD